MLAAEGIGIERMELERHALVVAGPKRDVLDIAIHPGIGHPGAGRAVLVPGSGTDVDGILSGSKIACHEPAGRAVSGLAQHAIHAALARSNETHDVDAAGRVWHFTLERRGGAERHRESCRLGEFDVDSAIGEVVAAEGTRIVRQEQARLVDRHIKVGRVGGGPEREPARPELFQEEQREIEGDVPVERLPHRADVALVIGEVDQGRQRLGARPPVGDSQRHLDATPLVKRHRPGDLAAPFRSVHGDNGRRVSLGPNDHLEARRFGAAAPEPRRQVVQLEAKGAVVAVSPERGSAAVGEHFPLAIDNGLPGRVLDVDLQRERPLRGRRRHLDAEPRGWFGGGRHHRPFTAKSDRYRVNRLSDVDRGGLGRLIAGRRDANRQGRIGRLRDAPRQLPPEGALLRVDCRFPVLIERNGVVDRPPRPLDDLELRDRPAGRWRRQ